MLSTEKQTERITHHVLNADSQDHSEGDLPPLVPEVLNTFLVVDGCRNKIGIAFETSDGVEVQLDKKSADGRVIMVLKDFGRPKRQSWYQEFL